METITMQIAGMACGGCSQNVKQALLALDGVIDAEVSHANGQAVVSFDSDRLTLSQLSNTVNASGYRVAG